MNSIKENSSSVKHSTLPSRIKCVTCPFPSSTWKVGSPGGTHSRLGGSIDPYLSVTDSQASKTEHSLSGNGSQSNGKHKLEEPSEELWHRPKHQKIRPLTGRSTPLATEQVSFFLI